MKINLVSLCLLAAISLIIPSSLSAQREVKTLNESWEFQKPDASTWTKVNLPHTYNDDAYKQKNYYQGKAYYRRSLRLADLADGRRYYLKFDGANKAADVSVNGTPVASHAGGYTAFIVDITEQVREENLIEVTVDNGRQDVTPLSADFTFFGGIYRDVWLISTPAQHFNMTNLGSDGIFIATPAVSQESATVSIASEVTNDGDAATTLELRNKLYGPDGSLLQTLTKKVKLKAGETQRVECLSKAITSPQLWSPEHPNLYQVVTTLVNPKTGAELDQRAHRIGLRWFHFDPDKGFFLNGQSYKLRGLNRHQDQAPMGTALDDDAHRRDVRMMKELGCNFFRISHYPQDDAILDACDELGILAWEEIPIVNYVTETPGYADNCETNLREMIRQHYNHPSVIAWGYMNEILIYAGYNFPGFDAEKSKSLALSLAQRLEAVAKSEDPSRSTVIAFNQKKMYPEIGLNLTDVSGWNLYPGWYEGTLDDLGNWCAEQHELYPDDPIIISEWGAGSDRRIHSLQPRVFDFSMEYQQTFIEYYMKYIEETDFICGAAYWNFIDFTVASRQESMPRFNNKGLTYNASRQYKDVAYFFKASWRSDIPVIHIASRDHDRRVGIAGQPQPIKIYSNMPEVELLVNGKSVGRQSTDHARTTFSVVLPEGESTLVARGLRDGVPAEDAMLISFQAYPDFVNGEELAINVGSNCFFTSDASHLTWLPDQAYTEGGWGYVGGECKSTTNEITGTPDNPLYQTWREGDFTYRIDAPTGDYEVELLITDASGPSMMEIYLLGKTSDATKAGTSFDVDICGKTVDQGLTPSDGGRYFTAFRRRYVVHNAEGCITIALRPVNGMPFVSGIKVRRLTFEAD